jgi:putative copper export protein/methionine-rich copper-binding protein CopC
MRRFLLGAFLAAAGVFVTPAAAWAHAELVSSDPGYGDRLLTAPAAVRLDFSGPIDLTGARVTLQRRGGKGAAPVHPTHASPDRRVVSLPLPRLADGAYTVVWFFLGNDGHLMGGETPFIVGVGAEPVAATPSGGAPAAPKPAAEVRTLGPGIAGPVMHLDSAEAAAPGPKQTRFTIAVATPQAVVRLLDYASLAILIGGAFFLARVWADGIRERRAQRLLWAALGASAVATLLSFGLTAAGLQGVGALEALRPSVIGTVLGTRYSRIMTIRALFLGLGFVALAMLTVGRDRAVRSRWWQALASVAGGGVVVTHALLGHVSNEGPVARLAVFVHVVGVSIWLGGLAFLAAVVVPRQRAEEVRILLPRFSKLAFSAVSAMVLAGAVMVLRVVPKVTELPQTGYGRVLLLKLGLVGLLLVAAQQARTFTERRLVKDSTRMRPLLLSVGVELTLAVVILTSTAVLVGRVPPERAPTNAASTLKGR